MAVCRVDFSFTTLQGEDTHDALAGFSDKEQAIVRTA
jgi:hypothetical protein